MSLDVCVIRPTIPAPLRERLRTRLPEIDPRKVILTATHTHTGPVLQDGKYKVPEGQDMMRPSEYVAFMLERVEDAIARAWKARRPGRFSWALGHAVVGQTRRTVYADGTAKMYGATNQPEFRGFEARAEHGLGALFFTGEKGDLLAAAINVACPSQEVESRSTVNADFWHDVRAGLRPAFANTPCVLGWPGASGDLSPHHLFRKEAEQRMLKLRGVTSTQEIARRIVREVNDLRTLVRSEAQADIAFGHRVEDVTLPGRKVTEKEVAQAQTEIDALRKKGDKGGRSAWHQRVIDRHRTQSAAPAVPVEVHVVRIGDVAIATNPFELFGEFGTRIQGRSKAILTLVVQLTAGGGTYLPTERAVAGGGYSAVVQSNLVGPEGGQVLVDRTVQMIDALWAEPK